MRKIAAVLVLTASLLSFPVTCPVFADVFKDAAAAFDRGDYKTMFRFMTVMWEGRSI